jgi:site-specific DNA recombinase
MCRDDSQRFSRGSLYAMLQNRMYRGEVTHKGASYPGEHQAIIEEALFDQVQSTLAANRTERVSWYSRYPSPLTGLLLAAALRQVTASLARFAGDVRTGPVRLTRR